jgi:ubiquinone biosynthesis monooxygenase Coq7
LGAVAIYRGQRAVLDARGAHASQASSPRWRRQEAVHLARLDQLLTERRVRPTALAPIWRLMAFALGAGTPCWARKAAHACTEAVETAIETALRRPDRGAVDLEPALAAELAGFRDEEIAHRDLAAEEGAREAPGYRLLSAVIGAGCRAAIKLSEKI